MSNFSRSDRRGQMRFDFFDRIPVRSNSFFPVADGCLTPSEQGSGGVTPRFWFFRFLKRKLERQRKLRTTTYLI